MGHGIAERLDGTLTRDNERRVLFVGLMLENVPQFLCVDAGVLEDGDEDGDEWSLTSECCIVGVDWGAFCFEEDCPRHRTALTSLTAIDSEVLNLTGAGMQEMVVIAICPSASRPKRDARILLTSPWEDR